MTASVEVPTRKKGSGLGLDAPLLVAVTFLVGLGLMMVYSASWDLSYQLTQSATSLFLTQLRNLGIGLVAMYVFFRYDYHRWQRWALWFLLLAVVALLVVMAYGSVNFNAQRGLREGSYQPSELAKLALVIYLAVWLNSKGEKIRELGYGLFPLIVIVGLVGGLILNQPDLSAAITVGVVAMLMFFLAGADLLQMGLVATGSMAFAWVLVQVFPTGRSRWAEYMVGVTDVRQASWHIQQAAIAFVNGGVLGRGMGEGRQKFGFLPAPHTDSIFAVVGEELGLIGCLFLLALFGTLIYRGMKIALNASDPLGRLLASGVTVWVGFEAAVNVAVIVGLLPFAGNALPFISYGGSSLVVTLAAMGLLLNVSRKNPGESPVRKTRATYDFGRRDGRRRVSRDGRRQELE